jgi:hypothetical protein
LRKSVHNIKSGNSERSHAHDLFGAAALAFGIICAGAVAETFSLWRDVDQYRASLPLHSIEGGMSFSLHFTPWMLIAQHFSRHDCHYAFGSFV